MINTIEQQIGAGNESIRPSRRWYLLAGCLLAAAAVCLSMAVIGMFSWDRQIQDCQRCTRSPGQDRRSPLAG